MNDKKTPENTPSDKEDIASTADLSASSREEANTIDAEIIEETSHPAQPDEAEAAASEEISATAADADADAA
ncbi:MAG: hypothetical protein AAF723_02400, partial [Pseudomonadota bacterium]